MTGKDRAFPSEIATGLRGVLGIVCLMMGASISAVCQSEAGDQVFNGWQDSIRTYIFSDHQKAHKYVDIYRENAFKQEDPFYQAKALNFAGMCAYVEGNALSAVEHYLESLSIFDSIGDARYSAVVMNNIGVAYLLRRKPMETIGYYERALEKFRVLQDTTWIANVMNNLSIQYVEMKEFEKALEMQLEVVGIFESLEDEASVLLMKGNMADTYRELGDYKTSRKLTEYYLAHPLADEDIQQKVNVLSTMSKLEALDKRYDSAVDHINEAIRLADNLQLQQEKANFLNTKSKILESMGRYPEALSSFKEFHQIHDTLYSKEKDERITELLTQYEVAQKEASIALLEKEQVISRRNQWLMGAGLLALGIILVLIISLYRNRQKNIAELKNKNDVISTMLNEKEYLIKEIHHRVKNNLQIISSLLQLQSRYLDEPNAIEALNDGENRVKSMAIIHHYLYTEDNMSQVDVRDYLNNLISNLDSSYNIGKKEIKIEQDIDPLLLDISLMIPLGLIINELVTNIYKYAFKEKDSGQIWLEFKEQGDDLSIQLRDNGIGKDLTNVKEGFGSRMIRAFIRKLEGSIHTAVLDGTQIQILIPNYRKHSVALKTA